MPRWQPRQILPHCLGLAAPCQISEDPGVIVRILGVFCMIPCTIPTSLRAAKGRWSRWRSSREIKAKTTERGYSSAAIAGRLSPGPRRRLSHQTGSLPASISRPPAAPSSVVVVADSGQRSPAFNKQARSIPRNGHRRSQLLRRRSP